MTMVPHALLGRELDGKYRIEELAGSGGFSVVFRAHHLVWDQPVAIKLFSIPADLSAEQRRMLVEAFVREGKLMSRLSSRCAAIVQARDVGRVELDGVELPYMVLEWLDGERLDEYVDGLWFQPLDLAGAMALIDPVASALRLAHKVGIAHRDLKPDNIFLAQHGDATVAKIMDFGIAKVMAAHQAHQEQLQSTGAHLVAFTPNYGAPEQFTRRYGATGPWTDVFAMALILLELMSGEQALAGDSIIELGRSACDPKRRPTPRGLGLDVSDAVEDVFEMATAVRPEDRYADMTALWLALHHALSPSSPTWEPDDPSISLSELLPGSDPLQDQPVARAEHPTHELPPDELPPDELSDAPTTLLSVPPPRSRRRAATVALASIVSVGILALLALAWPRPTSTALSRLGPLPQPHSSLDDDSSVNEQPPEAPGTARAEPAPEPSPPADTAQPPSPSQPSAPTASTPRPREPAPLDPFDSNSFGGRR